jgi:transglutaminase/protease-like cytokinesis protein 3
MADTITEAISAGNCITLYEYINQDKTTTEARLVTSAANALRRYTQTDNSVSKYRNDNMDARVRKLDGALMDAVFTDPEHTLPDLTSALVKGITDQFLKAKALHDWICDNIVYDTEMYFFVKNFPQDYISVLKKKAAVCEGYSNLYNEMCKTAGLESMVINGYSKGFGYRGTLGDSADHTWNAVKLNY